MAVLEIDVDTALVSPVRRQRRVGALFVCAVGWIALIGLAAIFADLLPIASPTDMDLLAKRAAARRRASCWAPTSSAATSSRA